MFEPRRILVPTDYSVAATAALELASRLAKSYRAKLIVLHSNGLVPPAQALRSETTIVKAFREQAFKLEMELAHYTAKHAADLPVRRLIVNDTPAAAILRSARESSADLIVMGTHGNSGLKRFVIGSVANEALYHARVPVITVRQSSNEIRRIICPVDYTATSRTALDVASQIARRHSAELIVLHLLQSENVSNLNEEIAALDWWIGEDAPALTRRRLVMIHQDPAQQVAEYANAKDADLIIIGACHRYFSDGSFAGTSAYDMVRRADQPVLTITDRCHVSEEPWLTEQELQETLHVW